MYSWNERYLMNNSRPILPVMGEFHFSRYPKEEWELELRKMKAGGIEIVATYVFWIHHEEIMGSWDFTGQRDLNAFLKLCEKVGLKVWLRIGPWAHGECRNGGFPDWLVQMEKEGKLKTRLNDERYLEFVDVFFERIAGQTRGMMCSEGGPIIGIQIENEYGHAGGPKDTETGFAHMNKLKEMANKHGLVADMYSATGWGGGHVPEGMLAVLGGYVDAPWANHTHELEASENFLFKRFHDDNNIASDFSDGGEFTFDSKKVPYLTAELGGGLQVTEHRRTYPYAEDIEAQTVCMLGAGANLIGYYMYHGGMNPDGKLTTLQESKATGYANNLPEKSYDFQAPLRENGLTSESFFKLKKYHTFIKSVEQILAPTECIDVEGSNNNDPENMTALRAMFRYNEAEDTGFLFINNHQRKRNMTEKVITSDNSIKVKLPNGDVAEFDNLVIRKDTCYIIPYKLKLGNATLLKTNASFLTYVGDVAYFYTDEEPYYVWDGVAPKVVTLSVTQAEHAYVCGDNLILSDGIVTEYSEDSHTTFDFAKNDEGEILAEPQTFKCLKKGEYEVNIDYSLFEGKDNLYDCILTLSFGGDKLYIYNEEGKLLTDWFANGEDVGVALKRFAYPKKLKLVLDEFNENVYYDLDARKENVLVGAWLKGVVNEHKS